MDQKIEFYLTIEVLKKTKRLQVGSVARMGLECVYDRDGEIMEKIVNIEHMQEPMLRLASGRNYNEYLKKYDINVYNEVIKIIKDRHVNYYTAYLNQKNQEGNL